MYFEIENTPEHIKRSRRKAPVKPSSPKEVCPRLILAPFSRPPQVIFENVTIGSTSERELEIFNPSKQAQQITLGKALPVGLIIHLPAEWLEVEPETCYCLTISWTPVQPTALRETIRFTNENRGRFDVSVVLKTATNEKRKAGQTKSFKISPGKIKKKLSKKSPVAVYKKKIEKITKFQSFASCSQSRILQPSNKDNISTISIDSHSERCPFDSPLDFKFDTSEVFSNVKKLHTDTYSQKHAESTYNVMQHRFTNVTEKQYLKSDNKSTIDITCTDIFDKLTFTPLKTQPNKSEKLEQGPKIILSLNSDSELDDSIENKNQNETHSIISITSTQPPNKWLTIDHHHHTQIDSQYKEETPNVVSKKIPNTSSPKELNSPNFSINTEFSRISDLSFFPPRFSTERKLIPKGNETHDLLEDIVTPKLHSDTYTKESPYEPLDLRCNRGAVETKPPHCFSKDKMCRQSLFRESQHQMFDKFYMNPHEHNLWHNHNHKLDAVSPPRSLSPPLQTIPEENSHCTYTRSEVQNTFTINRTFDRSYEPSTLSNVKRESWSKKTIKGELGIRQPPMTDKFLKPKSVPVAKDKESLGGMSTTLSNITFDRNKSVLSMSQIGNVYSQSLTVDPFSSLSYFYDEEAVDKFGKEFKRWLNCILTPPADLDSNIEQKVDVGKAWIENRNKEVPAAPTKEQVCSAYHNSHRLESLRRAAKTLLLSPEITLVFQKLNAQIEKKLIAIRADRNLHLDVGLQKVIMELLLAYNPLWLRIGLEALYGTILPLKSNSDIEGLSTFIIQRLFKNPYLRNKHSKSNAPNMLLPAYMEAIKKYTLKKFFMLIFFLDQAKQKKLIPHDPCLFCRNAICKESREIIIRFTRELIAGIGDITKHLRPLGYVVTHKQSYLDEYKYAVHNIAVDLRDGVRLTKVMEIILMKNGLLSMLRTPAISRLQKIHNVQVALNALKEANFVIEGDIKAVDIADGHREKTLSLLWQLIHVFRAPLFEKAANVIQIWWRKKYEVILEKRKEEEKIRVRNINAACKIQHWWRQIMYKRYMQWKLQKMTKAAIIVQKYFRAWVCRIHFKKFKSSVLKIELWYKSVKAVREAKETLAKLRAEREQARQKAATIIQRSWRRTYCEKVFRKTVHSIILVQSVIRMNIVRKRYLRLRKSVCFIQQLYRAKLKMRFEMKKLAEAKKSAIIIQSTFKMIKQYRLYRNIKKAVKVIEDRYRAQVEMRRQRKAYIKLKRSTIIVQALFRRWQCRSEFVKTRNHIVYIQRQVRAKHAMKRDRAYYIKIKKAVIDIQRRFRANLLSKKERTAYIQKRNAAVIVQQYWRSYLIGKKQRISFLVAKNAAITLQQWYRSLLAMRRDRNHYIKLRSSCICIQRQFRAIKTMHLCRNYYLKLLATVIYIQQKYKALLQMREQQQKYIKLKSSCVIIQNYYRAYRLGKQQKSNYLQQKQAAITIQNWFRSWKKGHQVFIQYHETKKACIVLQRLFRARIVGKTERQRFLKVRASTITIQRYYRTYKITQLTRRQYLQLKTSTIIVQRFYRSYLIMKRQRESYLQIKSATEYIQNYYRRYRLTKSTRENYLKLRASVINVQQRYRSLMSMRAERTKYLNLQKSVKIIQQRFRAIMLMRKEMAEFLRLKKAVMYIQLIYKARLIMRRERELRRRVLAAITIQRKYRANKLMKEDRSKYLALMKACIIIQSLYKARILGRQQRERYITLRNAAITTQHWYRNIREGRKIRAEYQQLRCKVILIQQRFIARKVLRELRRNKSATKIQVWYRSVKARDECRTSYLKTKSLIVCIQKNVRRYLQRKRYLAIKNSVILIQTYYRSYVCAKAERRTFLQIKNIVIKLQAMCRGFIVRNNIKRERAAITIQKTFRMYLIRSSYIEYRNRIIFIQRLWKAKLISKNIRQRFLQKKEIVIRLQALIRGYLVRQQIRAKKALILKSREEQRQHWAASKIQALFRGHKARLSVSNDRRIAELRRRWRDGGLKSTQECLKARHADSLDIIAHTNDMEALICAFKCLDFLTEVLPMIYNTTAVPFVRHVYVWMSAMNRSLPCIEVLKSAASLLVNLTRYNITGPKIYSHQNVSMMLKFMLRFSNSEQQLFCILCTQLWLFSKYDDIAKDLTEFLHEPDNHKMLVNIKNSIDRLKRMSCNAKDKYSSTPAKNNANHSFNASLCKINVKIVYPALVPDYGLTRKDRPRYFIDPQQAIYCLFETYKL